MATCTEQITFVNGDPASSYTTASFTPPAGSLLVVLATTSNAPGDAYSHFRDSESSTWWAPVASVNFNSEGGTYERIWIYARTAPVSGAPMTVEVYNTAGGFEDMLLSIVAVDGMALFGASAKRQSDAQVSSGGLYSTGVPYVDFPSAPLQANPILGIVADRVDPYPTTQPPSNFVQGGHGAVTVRSLSYSVCFINGGVSNPHVEWTGGAAPRHNTLAIELDTTGGVPWAPYQSSRKLGRATMEVKNSVATRVPVQLVSSAGAPQTGVAYGSVTASVRKADGTVSTLTVGSGDWSEKSGGAFASQGWYDLLVPASALDQDGILTYAVSVSGAVTYVDAVQVTAFDDADIYRNVAGRWKIHSSGPDANRLVVYDDDGVTPLRKYDLKDIDGNAAFRSVFERTPTP